MFHAHQSEFAELGWMGFFEAVEAAREALRPGASRRALALLPLVLLAGLLRLDRPVRSGGCGPRRAPPVETLRFSGWS